MEKVLITGATGIVGIALLDYCIHQGSRVLAVVRPNSNNISRLPLNNRNLTVVECDLDNINELPNIADKGYDAFYHLGWAAKGRSRRSNTQLQCHDIEITLKAVRAAKEMECGSFIGIGSQTEYGRINQAISPSMTVNPDTAYGIAKFAAGRLSSLLCSEIGLRYVWARIFSTYGPYDSSDSMIIYAIKNILKKEKPSFTPCEQLWDYLYCDDTARALYLLGKHGKDQSIYNVGSGIARPLKEYIIMIRDVIDPALPLGIGDKEYEDNQIMHLCADISSLTGDTGFVPEISFEEGIRSTIEWFKRTNTF
jgi:nucleoside-diphosphate-sugar epimerase